MIRKCTSLLACLTGIAAGYYLSSRQYKSKLLPKFDHNAIHIYDLEKSIYFYKKVMLLEQVSEPFKDHNHAWFKTGCHEQLHLIGGASLSGQKDFAVHFAFHVPSIYMFIDHLEGLHIPYYTAKGDTNAVTIRPDGVKQIYLKDPDGYWVEINNSDL